jgi:hypothetical protein
LLVLMLTTAGEALRAARKAAGSDFGRGWMGLQQRNAGAATVFRAEASGL